MSRPRCCASPIIWSSRGAARIPVLATWTTCRGAPVMAAAAMTSCSDSIAPPGSLGPAPRMCTWHEAPYSAAARKTSSTSHLEALGVYCMPRPTAGAPARRPASTRRLISATSSSVDSRYAPASTGRKSPLSPWWAMRMGMWPALAPKLMRLAPSCSAYQDSMSAAPTSSSRPVVTPSRTWMASCSGRRPWQCRSTKPGATTSPDASMESRPCSGPSAISSTAPPLMPMFLTASSPDSGSMTRPPETTMS